MSPREETRDRPGVATHRLSVLGRALARGRLRRVEAALAGFGTGEHGVCVVVLVFVFRLGGTSAEGIIAADC